RHRERRLQTIERGVELAIIQIRSRDAPKDRRCRLRLITRAKQIERALVVATRKLALPGTLRALCLVDQGTDGRRQRRGVWLRAHCFSGSAAVSDGRTIFFASVG